VLYDQSKEATGDIFILHERAILLVKSDFSYSCAAADKISTDLRRRAIAELLVSITHQKHKFP